MVLPTEKHKQVMKNPKRCTAFVGLKIFEDNFQVGLMGYYAAALLTLYYVCAFYTYSVRKNANLSQIMQQASIMVLSTQAPAKFYTFVTQGHEINNAHKWILSIAKEHEKGELIFRNIINTWVKRIQLAWRVLAGEYLTAYIVIALIPFISYFGFGKMILLTEFEFGVKSPELNSWLNVIVQLLQMTSYVVGMVISDFVLIMHVIDTVMLVDIWKAKLEIFEEILERGETCDHDIRRMMRDLAIWHQEFCRFTKSTSDCVFVQITVQICSSVLAIAITIFNAIISDWVSGYPVAFLFGTIMFAYCIVGTISEIQQEIVSIKLYEFKWYLLPVREQKVVLIMLTKTQHPHLLNVMGIVPLNVELGLKVTKMIYTYMMMLFNVVQ